MRTVECFSQRRINDTRNALQKVLISSDVVRSLRDEAMVRCAMMRNIATARACIENVIALCRIRRAKALAQAQLLFFSFCWCKRDVVRVDPRPY